LPLISHPGKKEMNPGPHSLQFTNSISNFYPGSNFINYQVTQQIDSCKSPIYTHSPSAESQDDEFSGAISGLSSNPPQIDIEGEDFYDPYAAQEIKLVPLKKHPNNSERSTGSSSKEGQDDDGLIEGMNSYFSFHSAEDIPSPDEAVSEMIKKKGPLKTENNQSIFKNKPKEQLEQAKALIEELLKLGNAELEQTHKKVLEENKKNDLDWQNDGEKLAKTIKEFEKQEEMIASAEEEISRLEKEANKAKILQAEMNKLIKDMKKLDNPGKNAPKKPTTVVKKRERLQEKINELQTQLHQIQHENPTVDIKDELEQKKKELKNLKRKLSPLRTKILQALKFKKFAPFTNLFPLISQFKKYFNKLDYLVYFQNYKEKRSMRYFEAYMKSEELYFWTVLFNIVLTLLPQDTQDISLLPLSKSATPFMAWLVDSSVMKIKHKNLFKCSQVRAHLRSEFERVASNLLMKSKQEIAAGNWSKEKENSLNNIFNALGRDWDAVDIHTFVPSLHKRSWESEEVDDYLQCSESEEEIISISKPQKRISKKH